MTVFSVPARGVGRIDYSSATEVSVEPVITSYQSLFMRREAVVVPALGNEVVDIPVPVGKVVMLYNFYASIPSNHLIRLVVQSIDSVGAVATVIDDSNYQTIDAPIHKGYTFLSIIRFIVYNYKTTIENYMRIGCAGLYTSSEEFHLRIGPPL